MSQETNKMDKIVGIISNVGFPIAAFLLMWRLANTTIKENTDTLKELKTHIKSLKQK